MKHLFTLLLALLAALWSVPATAGVFVRVGNGSLKEYKTADEINDILSKITTQTVTIASNGAFRIDGTINISSGNITVTTGSSRGSTVTNYAYLGLTDDSDDTTLFNITGGTVIFDETGANTAGGFLDIIKVSGSARVGFRGEKNFYSAPVLVEGGTVIVESGNFGLYRSSSGLEAKDDRYALSADDGKVTINGGCFVTSGNHSSIFAMPGVLKLKEGYELQDMSTDTPADWQSNGQFALYHSSAPANRLTLRPDTYEAEVIEGSTTTKVRDFEEAFSHACYAGHQVRIGLLRDITTSIPFCLDEDGDIILEGRDHTITATDETEYDSGIFSLTDNARLTLAPEGTGTLTLVNPVGRGVYLDSNASCSMHSVSITSRAASIFATGNSHLSITSGTYTASGTIGFPLDLESPNCSLSGGLFENQRSTGWAARVPNHRVLAHGYAFFSTDGDRELACPLDGSPVDDLSRAYSSIYVKKTNVKARVTAAGTVTDCYSIDEAWDVARQTESAVIDLQDDVFKNAMLTHDSGHITVNMGDYSLRVLTGSNVFAMAGKASLTLSRNGGSEASNSLSCYVYHNSSGTLTINGGHYNSTSIPFNCVTTTGKTIINDIDVIGNLKAVSLNNRHKLTINGGRFRNASTVSASAIYSPHCEPIIKAGYQLVDGEGNPVHFDEEGDYLNADGEFVHDIRLVAKPDPTVEVTVGSESTQYATLEEAVEAATSVAGPASIVLLDDITLGAPLTISKGNISLATGSHTISAAESVGTAPLITVNGGTLSIVPVLGYPASITNTYGPAIRANGNATLSISAANITANAFALEATGNANVSILGGTFKNTASNGYAVAITTPNCTVSGGRFENAIGGPILLPDYNVLAHGLGFVDGETSEELCIAFERPPFDAAGNTTRTVSVAEANVKATVTIDGVSTDYYHIGEAWDAAQAAEHGATIDLKDDSFIRGGYIMDKGDITLNMGHYVLSAIHVSSSSILTLNGGKLTINAPSVNPGGFRSDKNPGYAWPIYVRGGSHIVVNGGYHRGPSMGMHVGKDGEAVITGGTFEGKGDFGLYANGGHATLSGGRFVGKAAAMGNLTLPAGYAYYDISEGSLERLPDEQGGRPLFRADNSTATDVVVMYEDATFVVTTNSGGVMHTDDLTEAFHTIDPTTISSIEVLKDATITSTIGVASDLTVNLGSHTLSGASDVALLFNIMTGASLTVNANADGGAQALAHPSGMVFLASGGAKRIAIHGGRYESANMVLGAANANALEISDGYFRSLKSFAADFSGLDNTMVTGGRFVTEGDDGNGNPNYAVINEAPIAAQCGFFTPDGVELVKASGPLFHWDGGMDPSDMKYASDVTIQHVGARLSVTIGGTTIDYADVYAAFAAAQEAESATVTLKRDILMAENCLTLSKGNITVNMGEYYMATTRHGYVFLVQGSAELTLNRTGLTNRGFATRTNYYAFLNSGRLTINGGYFDALHYPIIVVGGHAEINGGTFAGCVGGIATESKVDCVIRGGRFVTTDPSLGGSAIEFGNPLAGSAGAAVGCNIYDSATGQILHFAPDPDDDRLLNIVDADGRICYDAYVAPHPITVAAVANTIKSALDGTATLNDINAVVNTLLCK